MVITGNLIALVLFSLISIVILFFVGRKLLKTLRNQTTVQ